MQPTHAAHLQPHATYLVPPGLGGRVYPARPHPNFGTCFLERKTCWGVQSHPGFCSLLGAQISQGRSHRSCTYQLVGHFLVGCPL